MIFYETWKSPRNSSVGLRRFPVQRGNVSLTNLQVVNAILYVAEKGCKWRALPKRFGNWHTIYTRMNRWAKAGGAACVTVSIELTISR